MLLHFPFQCGSSHAATVGLQDHGQNSRPSHLFTGPNIPLHELDMLHGDDVRVLLLQDDQVLMLQGNELAAVLDGVGQTVIYAAVKPSALAVGI